MIPASSAMFVLRRQFSGEPISKSVGCLKKALGRVYSRRPDSRPEPAAGSHNPEAGVPTVSTVKRALENRVATALRWRIYSHPTERGESCGWADLIRLEAAASFCPASSGVIL